MQWIVIAMLLLVAGWFILPRLSWISVDEATRRLRAGAFLLDVRSPAEFASDRLPGARNLPLGELERNAKSLALSPANELLVYCASGMRSAVAARQLKAMGYAKVWNLGTSGRARQVVALLETEKTPNRTA
jgi:rhodanese-related sulfurtransferase